jgi:hypothetical protein
MYIAEHISNCKSTSLVDALILEYKQYLLQYFNEFGNSDQASTFSYCAMIQHLVQTRCGSTN